MAGVTTGAERLSESCLQRLHQQAAKTTQRRQFWAMQAPCCLTTTRGLHCQLARLTALQTQPQAWMHPSTAAR